jgi:sporulation protein YlmC with PRC-barrel domain
MARLASTALMLALMTTVASAQTTQAPTQNREQAGGSSAQIMTSVPNDAVTVTHWYKQNVYDPSDNKIGEVMDVLVDKSGKIHALVVGVGGFLGAGEKDVAVPFDAVRTTQKGDNKWYLVMNSTKDALKNAKGLKYDRNTMTWIPEDQSRTTTGSGNTNNPGTAAPAPRPANPNPNR